MKTFTARGSDFRALNAHALKQSYLLAFLMAAVICLCTGLWTEAMAQATGSGIQWTKFDGETTRFVNWLKNRPLTSFFTIAAIIIGPVAVLCRSKCSFKPPSVRMRPGFSSPVLNAVDADCRSH